MPLLTLEAGDIPDKALVLARGLALHTRHRRHNCSNTSVFTTPRVQRFMPCSKRRADARGKRFRLSALIFRGDPRTRALAAASLSMSGEHTHLAVIALIPPDLVHVAMCTGYWAPEERVLSGMCCEQPSPPASGRGR